MAFIKYLFVKNTLVHNFQPILVEKFHTFLKDKMNYIFPIIKMNKLNILAAGELGLAIEPDCLNEEKG